MTRSFLSQTPRRGDVMPAQPAVMLRVCGTWIVPRLRIFPIRRPEACVLREDLKNDVDSPLAEASMVDPKAALG